MRVYFNEYGLLQGGRGTTAYLPLVSGVLHAWALEFPRIRDSYDFRPYLFHRDRADAILAQYDTPSVAAFSMSMWNANLCLTVARDVKRRHPECLIIFGGPSVPHQARAFMTEHRFIDVCVRGEGEDAFVELLERFTDSRDFSGIEGITWRAPEGRLVEQGAPRPFNKDLDAYPSPYLTGLFDALIETRRDLEFQAILETNRGCPFRCTFCYWGKGGLNRKFKFHGPDRIAREIDWMGRNGIKYILCADSNFGMHKQDYAIADALIRTRERYGLPERFRATYGKNTDEKIFEIANALWTAGLDKGVSLSRQSNDVQVQTNIKRGNIKMSTYRNLQQRFNEAGIPTHTDLIVGLPGETLDTLAAGIDEILDSDCVHLNMYFLEVYPNTDMANPDYRRQHGIRTVRTELRENHCDVRDTGLVPEWVDVVVQTNSMDSAEWRRMWLLAFVTMMFHSLKLGFFLMHYLRKRFDIPFTAFLRHISEERMAPEHGGMLRAELRVFRSQLDDILEGGGHNVVQSDFGNVYWRIEEAGFLRISRDHDRFYAEMEDVIRDLLQARGIAYDAQELREVVRYQRLRMPATEALGETRWAFSRAIPAYFEAILAGRPADIAAFPQTMTVESVDYGGDKARFARERVLYARKNESTLNAVRAITLPEAAE